MDVSNIEYLFQHLMVTGLIVLVPILAITFVVAILIGIIQAMTQINEQTLSFAPKIIVVGVITLAFGGMMFDKIVQLIKETLEFAPTIF